jgi:hypothetical protein
MLNDKESIALNQVKLGKRRKKRDLYAGTD